jgi:hypothetical protein
VQNAAKLGPLPRAEARNVEVQLVKLWEVVDGREVEDPVFLPMRLVWAHVGIPVRARIPPGLYSHCDLLRIAAGSEETPWLELQTEVQPNSFPSGAQPGVKPGGTYVLELAVAASNAATRSFILQLKWDGVLDPTSDAAMRTALSFAWLRAG